MTIFHTQNFRKNVPRCIFAECHSHRIRIKTEAQANCRHCFFGGKWQPTASLTIGLCSIRVTVVFLFFIEFLNIMYVHYFNQGWELALLLIRSQLFRSLLFCSKLLRLKSVLERLAQVAHDKIATVSDLLEKNHKNSIFRIF